MGILLSDKQLEELLGEDFKTVYSGHVEEYRSIAKAQSKRWMELLKQRAMFVAWEWKDSKGIWEIRFDDNEWQELQKEVEE